MYFPPTKSVSKFAAFFFILLSTFTANTFAQNANASPKGLSRGQAAINKLNDRLPMVAQKYGKSPNELRRLFIEDSTLYVDDTENLVYIDDATEDFTAEKTEITESAAPLAAAASYDYSQTFKLHSRPGSNRVIYLDFNGHVTSNTQWNTNYTGGQPINSAPFSIDADPTTFNTQEQDAIQYIWQRVAEDYAPFDVDVTTEDPGDAAIFRTTSTDLIYGTRAVISPTNFTGNSIGGIAYVGVFNGTGTNYKPAFVMTSGLGNNEKNIAEATSHEVGHNLGLNHDGKRNADGTTTGYYSGHGDWAPIMGVGYYKAVSQWSKGEYPGANQLQDDLAVIQTYGLPVISDDHGNTNTAATVLSGGNITSSGIIMTRSDVDVFQFSTGDGNVVINLNPASYGANLDIQAKIANAQGNIVATINPLGLPASINQFLSAGVYYLTVDGVGAGDLTTGYSDYASIGQYSITGTLAPTNTVPPTAAITTTTISGTTPLTVGFNSDASSRGTNPIIGFSWNFGDGTTATTDPNPVHIYNSAGTFTAVLKITDSAGLTDTESVVITVTQSANLSPTAIAGADRTSINTGQTVNFSSSGSTDPDGTIASYLWNFGDGTSSNQANPSHIYNTTGSFTSTLTVTDNGGATHLSSIVITVQQAPITAIYVEGISMSLVSSGRNTSARAVITVYDSNGAPCPNATVTGNWSGLTTGGFTGTTNTSGQVVVTSAAVKKSGSFTINVTNLSASRYTYNPTQNIVTSASISN
jgi:PKD repeat protein